MRCIGKLVRIRRACKARPVWEELFREHIFDDSSSVKFERHKQGANRAAPVQFVLLRYYFSGWPPETVVAWQVVHADHTRTAGEGDFTASYVAKPNYLLS